MHGVAAMRYLAAPFPEAFDAAAAVADTVVARVVARHRRLRSVEAAADAAPGARSFCILYSFIIYKLINELRELFYFKFDRMIRR